MTDFYEDEKFEHEDKCCFPCKSSVRKQEKPLRMKDNILQGAKEQKMRSPIEGQLPFRGLLLLISLLKF